MQLNIGKHYFYELDGILGIKAHIEKLNNVVLNDSTATGEIEINLSYSDVEGMECFKVLNFPFELQLDELKIIDINLADVVVAVIEGQGIDVEYSLVVNYLVNDKVVEVEPITENIIVEEKECKEEDIEIKKIKEDISKDYENKLADSLQVRNESVIATKTHSSVDSFLSFFDDTIAKRYSIKTIYVEKDEDLDKISKEYNVPIDLLLAGYDKNNHKVMFKVDK